VRVIRSQLQGVGVGVRGFGVPAEAGQCVPLEPECGGVADPDRACRFCEGDGGDELALADGEQNGDVAQLDASGRCRDSGCKGRRGRFGPAGGRKRIGEALAKHRVRRHRLDRLGQTPHRVLGLPKFQHQDAEQRLGRRVVPIVDHRFGRIGQRAGKITELAAGIGAQHEQVSARRYRDRLPECLEARRRATLAHFQSGGERGHARPPLRPAWRHALGGDQQRARRTGSLRAEQFIRALGQRVRIGGGIEQVHAELLLSGR